MAFVFPQEVCLYLKSNFKPEYVSIEYMYYYRTVM